VSYLAEAEQAFRTGVEQRDDPVKSRDSFRQAAECYDELRRRGANNAALHCNLANAYLLAGDVPGAILAYRRGLRFAPSDHHLQAGLAYARGLVAIPSGTALGRPPIEQRPPWLPRLRAGWYLTIAFVAYSLACLAAARWWMTRRGLLLWLAASSLCIAVSFIIGVIGEEWRDAEFVNRPVVVINDDGVLLRTGNGLRYPPRSETPLNRGVEARLLFVREDWLQIELSGGEIGWVPREYALVDDG
jgi:hypothetical protein